MKCSVKLYLCILKTTHVIIEVYYKEGDVTFVSIVLVKVEYVIESTAKKMNCMGVKVKAVYDVDLKSFSLVLYNYFRRLQFFQVAPPVRPVLHLNNHRINLNFPTTKVGTSPLIKLQPNTPTGMIYHL